MKWILKNKITCIILLSIIIRVLVALYYLPFYNQDELTILYDAKSIVETGQDRWQTPTHLFYRSLGKSEFRPPLMIWIQTLAYYLFGIEEFGARLISVIFGLIGLFCSYKIVKFFTNDLHSKVYLFILLFAPVHILQSAMAFESASLSSSILLLSIYFFCRFYNENKILDNILFSFFLSLSVYTYPALKLVSPLFGLLFLYIILNKKLYKNAIVFIIVSIVTILPQVYLFINYPTQFLARATANVPMKRKVIEYFFKIFEIPFLSLLNISDWFITFEKNIHNLNILFLYVQFPFFLIGLYVYFFERKVLLKYKNYFWIILLGYLISCTPEIATFCNLNIFRNPLLVYYIAFFISIGVYKLRQKLKLIVILIFVNFIFSFCYGYFQLKNSNNFQNDLVLLYSKLEKYHSKYNKVYIENKGNQPYIYLLYYSKISPSYFQKSIKVDNCTYCIFDNIEQIGKFYFLDKENIIKNNYLSNELLISSLSLDYKRIDSSDNFIFYEIK